MWCGLHIRQYPLPLHFLFTLIVQATVICIGEICFVFWALQVEVVDALVHLDAHKVTVALRVVFEDANAGTLKG